MAEAGDRNSFLAALRARRELAPPGEPLRPVEPWNGAVPPVTYRVDTTDLVAQFIRALETVNGEARRVAGRDDLRARLDSLRAERQVRRAVVSRDPECEGVVEMLRDLGVDAEVLTGGGAAAAADLGVTGAAFGVALTGSLLVDARRAGGRTASLLPPLHLALLRAERIVATPGALLRALPRHPDGLPSNLVLITGPSRSADIELQLTLGVHGPREVWVAIL
jgi:L-lactate dehydrogenase complex protein LldG